MSDMCPYEVTANWACLDGDIAPTTILKDAKQLGKYNIDLYLTQHAYSSSSTLSIFLTTLIEQLGEHVMQNGKQFKFLNIIHGWV